MALAYTGGSGGGGSGGGVKSVTAGDTSISVGGTATNPTVETADLATIAADHATAGDVALGGHKITGLANGTAASDAAAFGQIPTVTGGLVTLFDSTLATAAASIDTGANGIAAGHGTLVVTLFARTSGALSQEDAQVVFNADTGAHYYRSRLRAIGSTVAAATQTGGVSLLFTVASNGAATGVFGSSVSYIPNYDNTSLAKTGNIIANALDTTAANMTQDIIGFLWNNTAAISQAVLSVATGNNLLAGTRLLIQGTK